MCLSLVATTLLFTVVVLGLAWPWAVRIGGSATESLLIGAGLSLVGTFGFAWLVYVCGAPWGLVWILPLLATAGLARERRRLLDLWRDAEARNVVVGQVLVSAWCIGWLGCVASYSGGGWSADWFEHWERARFFFLREPLDAQFLGRYALTARPPLANVVTASFLAMTRLDFAHFQLLSTLLGSLVFIPTAALARRWGGPRAIPVVALALMLNPSFVQNATFSWTKLPAAFFTLAAVHFFLQAFAGERQRRSAILCGVFLAAGALAHYSAAPYFLVLAVIWFIAGRSHLSNREWRGATASTALAAGVLLALWFGWSLAVFSWDKTFLANSTVMSADARQGSQLVKIALNLVDTIVPHFLRPLDASLIAQRSVWGAWRDWFFQCYQVNLPLAFGSVAWVVLARGLWRRSREVSVRTRNAWALAIVAAIVLGVAVHGQRDHWGLAHICLQPLIVLGLAFLAARWSTLSRAARVALAVGAVLDFACGIALHFGVQSFLLDPAFENLSEPARMNLNAKIVHRLAFFSDAAAAPAPVWTIWLTAVFALAAHQAARQRKHA